MATFPVVEVLQHLPQAVACVDTSLRAVWVEPSFANKCGIALETGASFLSLLEPGNHREALETAVRERRSMTVQAMTCTLRQIAITVQPSDTRHAWLVIEPAGLDQDASFLRALQDIASAIGESIDLEAICMSAVLAVVRCAQVARAQVYLCEEPTGFRLVASSGEVSSVDDAKISDEALKLAIASQQPQIGIARGTVDGAGVIFAAVPLVCRRRSLGTLVLIKGPGDSFSARELDLWSAAGAQLAIAVENAQLLQEAKAALQVREDFMSIASHELRTPLTPLKMCLFTMERKLADGVPIELSSIVKAKRQVDRLTELVADLLDASRLEMNKLSVELAPVELRHLLRDVVDGFRTAFARPFNLSLPPERVWVHADRARLEQVVVNLIDNAQKYSPSDAPVEITLERRRGEARLRVADHGIGIPAGERDHIFERFYRARNASRRNFPGLGLGLFISRSIMALHRGELSLHSEEGKGTTFVASMPYLPGREVRKLPRRVLVIDGDDEQEQRASQLLSEAGFDVAVSKTATEALKRLTHEPMDGVVMNGALAKDSSPWNEVLRACLQDDAVSLLLAGEGAGGRPPACERPYRAELVTALNEAIGAAAL